VMATGSPALEQFLKGIIEKKHAFGSVHSDVSPYQDMFPFAAAGVPGVWFTRKTHEGGYWYHHSSHSTLENCCMEQIARTAETASDIVGRLANADGWPFQRRISAPLKRKIEQYRREFY